MFSVRNPPDVKVWDWFFRLLWLACRLWGVLVPWQALSKNNYNNDELVREFNVKIEPAMVKVRGRVLDPPSVSPFPSFRGLAVRLIFLIFPFKF